MPQKGRRGDASVACYLVLAPPFKLGRSLVFVICCGKGKGSCLYAILCWGFVELVVSHGRSGCVYVIAKIEVRSDYWLTFPNVRSDTACIQRYVEISNRRRGT